jgi:methylated-DNA-[protein]-cysteine S-methyltransferase
LLEVHVRSDNGVWFGAACDDVRVFATSFGFSEKSVLESLTKEVPDNVPFQREAKASALAARVLEAVRDVYHGKDCSDGLPLSMEHLSSYARNVLKTVIQIPVGYVSSYGLVAKAAGGSARAVGRVMATNPFAPIVPCHRVVTFDYGLGGYGGGVDVKLAFLGREKRGYTSAREIPVGGKKLHVFPVEFVLKRLGKE